MHSMEAAQQRIEELYKDKGRIYEAFQRTII